MDSYSNHGNEPEAGTDYAYPVNEASSTTPVQNHATGPGFGYALLKALRLAQTQDGVSSAVPADTQQLDQGAQFAGFVSNTAYLEPAPIYRGEYKNLSPLYFNTEPVDNANDTRLDYTKLTGYSRAQLFFLLRLERFLRLRHHWQAASPRADETWKTELVMRSIFSAYQDCVKHQIAEDASKLLKCWNCC